MQCMKKLINFILWDGICGMVTVDSFFGKDK